MDTWITIRTFTLPSEAAVLQARLEAEGIECFLLNENTVHANPLLSNAIGGVHLQVKETDLDTALEILRDGGYATESEISESKWLKDFDKISADVPFLKKFPVVSRFIIVIVAIAAIIISLILYAKLPTTYEKLTKYSWCLDYLTYKDKDYIPNTIADFKFVFRGACYETITFKESSIIELPGFDSREIKGRWKLEEGVLMISNVDTFDHVLNGAYKIDFNNDGLTLESEKTILQCHSQNIAFFF